MIKMNFGDYSATIEFDAELGLFRGEILDLRGGADFYGEDSEALRREFSKSLSAYLDVCAEKTLPPLARKSTSPTHPPSPNALGAT